MERKTVARAQRTPARSEPVNRQSAGPRSARHPIAILQRSIGSQAVQRLINSPYIQAKLNVSSPGDPAEKEADQVAEKVMRMPVSPTPSPKAAAGVQRKCAACTGGPGACPKCAEEKQTVQRKPLASGIFSFVQRQVIKPEDEKKDEPLEAKNPSGGISPVARSVGSHAKPLEPGKPLEGEEEHQKQNRSVQLKPSAPNTDGPVEEDEGNIDRQLAASVESRLSSSKGGGEALPESVRTHMESAIGADFSGVKVHTDQSAVQMNQDLGAKAFTHGRNIYFNRNVYSPNTSSGKQLLAHELTHVVQQSGGALETKARPDDEKDKDKIKQISRKDMIQRHPDVTALAGPAEMPAGLGKRVTLRATAPRGTVVNWSITAGGGTGAVLGGGTGVTNTLTAPAGSTGGLVTVQADDAGGQAVPVTHDITVVEVQQPTFAFAPPMPAFAPPNTMDASVCGNNATAQVVTVPGGRPVTWSIVGNRLGATIVPATGVIVPSATQTGNIVVRATDNAVRDAHNQQTLTIQAHPTGISRTSIVAGGFPMPAASGGPYGAFYTHAFSSSGGNIANVMITEQVFSGNNPFLFGGLPVLPGLLNAPAGALQDQIGSPAGSIDVNNFLPSPPNPGLPQVLNTPQILYWRSDQCSPAPAAPPAAAAGDHWVPFVNVPIKATLLRRGANFFFITSDNGVPTPAEPYIGTALAPAAAPVASVCGAGEGLSNVTFSPGTIAADGSGLTTTAATVNVRPGGNLVTWSFPGPNFGATILRQGNPALFGAGNIAGQVVVRVAMTATPGCFAEGRLGMREVEIGPAISFSPATVRAGGTTRARVSTKPGPRIVLWTIVGPPLGAVIAANPDNSATITAGAVGRITIRATDQRDATKFTEVSLVIT